ncbi:MAG: hypothetical protein Kow0029_25150 [Candidatus Rifleibacteriota bacterium]
MKKVVCVIILFLLCSVGSYAKYCIGCGMEIPDVARFCSSCGMKQVDKEVKQSATSVRELEKSVKSEPAKFDKNIYRAKTDIYLYEKRGDEKDVLKKNLFFKPRRYRMKRNSHFRILEKVANSYLVQSLPDKDGRTLQGWVYEEQLSMRSDWQPQKQHQKK